MGFGIQEPCASAIGINIAGAGAGAGAEPKGDGIVVMYGFGVVAATNPKGVSTHIGVVGPGVVTGGYVGRGGGIVGAGVIFARGGGPSVGSQSSETIGRLGRPGSGLPAASGNGGGGPGSGSGSGGGAIGGCANAAIVVVGAGIENAIVAPAPPQPCLPCHAQLHPEGMPRCVLSQLAICPWPPADATLCKELLLRKNSEAALELQHKQANQMHGAIIIATRCVMEVALRMLLC